MDVDAQPGQVLVVVGGRLVLGGRDVDAVDRDQEGHGGLAVPPVPEVARDPGGQDQVAHGSSAARTASLTAANRRTPSPSDHATSLTCMLRG